MKSWKDKRNYRKLKDSNGCVSAYIITIDGVDVQVTEEIYKSYSQADRRERYMEGESALGTVLSLEQMEEDDMRPEYLGVALSPSAEEFYLKQCADSEKERLYEALSTAIRTLTDDEQELIQTLYYSKLPATAYAKQKGVSEMAVRKRRDRILKKIKKFLSELGFEFPDFSGGQ